MALTDPGYSVTIEIRSHQQSPDGEWRSVCVVADTLGWFREMVNAVDHMTVIKTANEMLRTGDLELPEPPDGDPDG